MSWSIVIQLSLTLALTVGAAASATLILKTFQAEREWRKAARRMPEESVRLCLDIIEEHRAGFGENATRGFERRYLADALEEAIEHLRAQHQLSQSSAEQIAHALHQPSETGRQLYAAKLALEALKARDELNARSHLVGA